jgi:superfamily II DNA or RNA helicase
MERKQYSLKVKATEMQETHIAFMNRKKAVLLVEKAGKGKTFSCLSSFAYLYNTNKLDSLLVLTPKNAYDRRVWKENAMELTNIPTMDIETLYQKAGLDESRIKVYLQQYPVIYGKHTHPKSLGILMQKIINLTRCRVVIDEVHKFKNQKSTMTIAAKMYVRDYTAIVGLTATPLSKNLEDTYNIIHFIKPWFLGTYDSFKREFCKTKTEVVGRYANGALHEVERIIGVLNQNALDAKLAPLVIKGCNEVTVQWHDIPYTLDFEEKRLYQRLAKGLFASSVSHLTDKEEWFKKVMNEEIEESYVVKDVKRHSSRFIYLQFAANGIISKDGEIGTRVGTKCKEYLSRLKEIYSRGESAIIYFEYYASLKVMENLIRSEGLDFVILKTTGKETIPEGKISKHTVKVKPHLIMSTKAGSESSSFYYINNVMLFEIPTTPETFTQIIGRITRINTLFKGNLHAYLPYNENIDMYKIAVVCNKAVQMEAVAGEEENIPEHYKEQFSTMNDLKALKKYLLWELK